MNPFNWHYYVCSCGVPMEIKRNNQAIWCCPECHQYLDEWSFIDEQNPGNGFLYRLVSQKTMATENGWNIDFYWCGPLGRRVLVWRTFEEHRQKQQQYIVADLVGF